MATETFASHALTLTVSEEPTGVSVQWKATLDSLRSGLTR